ncbi:hypothetical protein P59_179 [Bacillus phage P59]|nr:hypothetical protein P59_179 [Bacillus phage P59]
MPIINFTDETVQLEFGHGDIRVSPGLLNVEEVAGGPVGVVCFFRQDEARPIGERQVLDEPLEVEQPDTPVRMTFEKVESIDVVIRALEKAKQFMINKEVDTDF